MGALRATVLAACAAACVCLSGGAAQVPQEPQRVATWRLENRGGMSTAVPLSASEPEGAVRGVGTAQDDPGTVAGSDGFVVAMRRAVSEARKSGKISRREAIRLQVALFSPAFRQTAREFACVQMAFSGEEVPVDDTGRVDASSIDWGAIADFLERVIPILLDILDRYL